MVGIGKKDVGSTVDIKCNDLCVIGNEMWFSNADMNGLYKKEVDKETADFVSFFPNEPLWRCQLHGSVIHYKDKLVFTPWNAVNISVYDLKEGVFSTYKIDWAKEGIEKPVIFVWAVLHQTYVYMFGYAQPYILRFDIESGRYCFVGGWFEQFQRFGYHKERELFSEKGIIVEEKIYLFTKQNNVLIEFDLNNEEFLFYTIGYEADRFMTAEYNDGNFWLINVKNELFGWNKTDGVIKRVPVVLDSNYYRSIRYDKYIIFVPSGNGKIAFCIDSATGIMEWKSTLEYPAQFLKKMFGSIFFCSRKNSILYSLDGQAWKARGRLVVDSFVYSEIRWKVLTEGKNKPIYENRYWELKDFLTFISART